MVRMIYAAQVLNAWWWPLPFHFIQFVAVLCCQGHSYGQVEQQIPATYHGEAAVPTMQASRQDGDYIDCLASRPVVVVVGWASSCGTVCTVGCDISACSCSRRR